MGLRIPANAECLIPRCDEEPTHVFSVRMRRKDSGADWAPNTEAYFCERHANDGARISVFYEPIPMGFVTVSVQAVTEAASRTTPIDV